MAGRLYREVISYWHGIFTQYSTQYQSFQSIDSQHRRHVQHRVDPRKFGHCPKTGCHYRPAIKHNHKQCKTNVLSDLLVRVSIIHSGALLCIAHRYLEALPWYSLVILSRYALAKPLVYIAIDRDVEFELEPIGIATNLSSYVELSGLK